MCALGFTNRGVKRRDKLLVMNTVKKRYGISHALIETCFIDDADDMALYRKVKPQLAKAIAAGIAEGFGLKYNGTTLPEAPATEKKEKENITMTKAEIRKLVTQAIAGMDVPSTATNTAKKAAQDVVQTTFQSIYNNANPMYTSIGQIPDYWKSEVQELIKCGAIKGDGVHEVSIRRDALQAAVIAFRAVTAINN